MLPVERLNFAVIRIPKFISSEICRGLLVEAKAHVRWISLDRYDESNGIGSSEAPRQVEVSSGLATNWQPSPLFPALAEITKQCWGVTLSTFSKHGVSRYSSGSSLPVHQDCRPDDNRLVTFVIYLSAANIGGEIQFPTLGLSFSPQPMDLVAFPSNLPHMVTVIEEGERCSVVWFGE